VSINPIIRTGTRHFRRPYHPTRDSIEETWSEIKSIYVGTTENILGFREIKKNDWMSEETWTKVKNGKI
jgi:hypothetical protein